MVHTIGFVFADYPPINTNLATPGLTNKTVVINTSFNLTCNAHANPPAKYRFFRQQQSLFNTTAGNNTAVYTTSVSERIKQVTYSCTPFNDYGDGPTQTITVTVHCKYTFLCWGVSIVIFPYMYHFNICKSSFLLLPVCLFVFSR